MQTELRDTTTTHTYTGCRKKESTSRRVTQHTNETDHLSLNDLF